MDFIGFMNLIWLLNFLMATELHITSFISPRVQDFEHCLKSVWRKDKASLCAVYIFSAPSEELVFFGCYDRGAYFGIIFSNDKDTADLKGIDDDGMYGYSSESL